MKRPWLSQKGYSLVEMLVVATILGIVATGIGVVFISGQRQYTTREATIRMQQQARQAVTLMERDLKLTAYGLMELGSLRINTYYAGLLPVPPALVEWTNGTAGNPLAPDTLTVYFQNPALPTDTTPDVLVAQDYLSSKPNNLRVTNVSSFAKNDLFFIYDPADLTKPASLLQVSDIPGSDKVLKHTENSFNPPNSYELFPSGGYPIGSRVLNYSKADIRKVRFSLDAHNTLKREEWISTSSIPTQHIVAAGVEDLQFRYQFRNGQWLDAPVAGDANHDIGNLRALQISVRTRTTRPDPHFSGDGYRRLTITTTVSLRNLAMRNTP